MFKIFVLKKKNQQNYMPKKTRNLEQLCFKIDTDNQIQVPQIQITCNSS